MSDENDMTIDVSDIDKYPVYTAENVNRVINIAKYSFHGIDLPPETHPGSNIEGFLLEWCIDRIRELQAEVEALKAQKGERE